MPSPEELEQAPGHLELALRTGRPAVVAARATPARGVSGFTREFRSL
jgi:hypothetical protein